MVRAMDGYNKIVFPHCNCDSYKNGDIILATDFSKLTVQACDYEGKTQDDVLIFDWSDILTYEIVDNGAAFTFKYSRPGKKSKTVKFNTQFAVYMNFCFSRILEEHRRHSEVNFTKNKD
ncbi:unnamed protein product [Thelazia callipaeda]|uniref:Ricin B-type lectin domain-containing protein n=1 Tax=Thelazia callipaeda TaxID=103827 RepID=A0A0N5D8P3_THECL|nr:unnamed protein product [Thelazia callipaeda]